MLHLMKKLFEAGLTVFSVSVLHHAVVLLLLTHHCGGQPLVVGPSQPVIVNVGDDVILPCHLEPAVDAINMTVEWARPELNPRFVHVWHGRKDHQFNLHQSYKGRTSVSIESLKHGDISLKLSKVKLSDNGIYRCTIPNLNTDSTVELVVGADSEIDPYSVTFVGENQKKDDLYCFTPAVFYSVSSCSLGVIVTLIVVAYRIKKSADLLPRRLRRNSSETTGLSPDSTAGPSPGSITGLSPGSTTGLLSATSCSQRQDDLHAVMELKKEVENQKEQLEMQLEMIEREKEENKISLESLEEKRKKTVDKQQLIKEKENLNETRWKLEEKRKDTQKVLIETEKLLQILNAAAQRMSTR